MAAPETETDVRPEKMSSGEALAKILATVERIELRMDHVEEIASVVVEQVQEVAASGLGSLLGGVLGGKGVIEVGDSEHSEDPS